MPLSISLDPKLQRQIEADKDYEHKSWDTETGVCSFPDRVMTKKSGM